MSKVIYLVGEAVITCPMPEKPHLKWSDEAESAELVRKGLEEAKGSWPDQCLQRAFVEGAKWWEYKRTGATMWQDDQGKAEQAAIDKYGIDPIVASDRTVEDGLDISTFNLKNFEECILLMGGNWIRGSRGGELPSGESVFFSSTAHSQAWDEHNQPTRWKPL